MEQLQQRTSQAIDTMKREAKEEREKIAKRVEAMIEVTLISHWALINLIPLMTTKFMSFRARVHCHAFIDNCPLYRNLRRKMLSKMGG